LDALLKGASANLAEPVLPGLAAGLAVGALPLRHLRTFFAGYSAYSDFHLNPHHRLIVFSTIYNYLSTGDLTNISRYITIYLDI
jgi:hypothetical protein